MPKRRKSRKNTRKGRRGAGRFKFIDRLITGFKFSMAIAAVMVVTGFFILVHDLLTQCDYFGARQLTVEGMQRLTREQVAQQAGVHTGINILSTNLTLARKRLLAHPWIAEAEISREIPAGLTIVIKEHTALAMVDFGQKYLINTRGEIFKAWDPSDPKNLPVVSGLNLSDLTVYGRAEPSQPNRDKERSAPFKAVMQVLQLGGKKGSILPNRVVKQIQVDRQIGLSVHAFDRSKTINLGYSDYADKYQMLSNLFSYLKHHRSISDFDRIDLNNLQRVVVSPISRKSETRNPKSETIAKF
ncbi:MAG: FtsQ-type POTRA domain-containing protein [Proteobacteria bacterium]|nr:FtsQ-type POTRA domain-containing protein [Pseudomonadota bacterium]